MHLGYDNPKADYVMGTAMCQWEKTLGGYCDWWLQMGKTM